MKCFRPLSGKWGYRFGSTSHRNAEQVKPVSVPSRGNGVIDTDEEVAVDVDDDTEGFRPLSGKWGYRFVQNEEVFTMLQPCFRPLSGKWGYRFYNNLRAESKPSFLFPSPLGEMGLSIGKVPRNVHPDSQSFRPLSGKWGYRSAFSRYLHTLFIVSVPSRGNGVIDRHFAAGMSRAQWYVSVPSRGNGVID